MNEKIINKPNKSKQKQSPRHFPNLIPKATKKDNFSISELYNLSVFLRDVKDKKLRSNIEYFIIKLNKFKNTKNKNESQYLKLKYEHNELFATCNFLKQNNYLNKTIGILDVRNLFLKAIKNHNAYALYYFIKNYPNLFLQREFDVPGWIKIDEKINTPFFLPTSLDRDESFEFLHKVVLTLESVNDPNLSNIFLNNLKFAFKFHPYVKWNINNAKLRFDNLKHLRWFIEFIRDPFKVSGISETEKQDKCLATASFVLASMLGINYFTKSKFMRGMDKLIINRINDEGIIISNEFFRALPKDFISGGVWDVIAHNPDKCEFLWQKNNKNYSLNFSNIHVGDIVFMNYYSTTHWNDANKILEKSLPDGFEDMENIISNNIKKYRNYLPNIPSHTLKHITHAAIVVGFVEEKGQKVPLIAHMVHGKINGVRAPIIRIDRLDNIMPIVTVRNGKEYKSPFTPLYVMHTSTYVVKNLKNMKQNIPEKSIIPSSMEVSVPKYAVSVKHNKILFSSLSNKVRG